MNYFVNTWSVGKSVKSSGGFVMTYLFDEASHDELVSRNLKNTFIRKSHRNTCDHSPIDVHFHKNTLTRKLS